MMKIIQSYLFKKFPEIIYGFSTKVGLNRKEPYYFNMSYSVGDKKEIVEKNRKEFFKELGLNSFSIAYQKQIHSDIVKIVDKPGYTGISDALITHVSGIGLAISSADCAAIFIYDPKNKIIAAVHSGWKGTHKKILEKTLHLMFEHFHSEPKNLFAYIAPSISQKNYEVKEDVASLFDSKYLKKINGRIFLDIKKANQDILLENGIPAEQIEISELCSFEEKDLLHSYRRDGKFSGRALGIIAMREI
ncbi:MAG: peptidoglycan editing factor PgeF [Melioribacter sp.]|uniref:peptidoglycan editing factor PgeF n=1 Tax=Rosettibacter primus TaxID=3111523 RepID=UPI00247DC4F6|nr:peptidoglycan editing factor PgeF [Melioribacter sp.]